MELLRDLHRNGATICMVTHDQRYAHHAERTIHLFDGRIVEETQEAPRRSLSRSGVVHREPRTPCVLVLRLTSQVLYGCGSRLQLRHKP